MKKQVSLPFMICGMIFTVCLIISNIVGQKLIRVFGFDITAGILIFPITYIINDLIAEVWGYRKMRLIIWSAFSLNFLTAIIFRISIIAPPSPHFRHQHAFALVLQNSERIIIASFIAFLIGSFINAYIMSKMKIMQHGKHFSIRAVVSTIFGEGADSLVFFTIAFAGTVKTNHLLVIIVTQTVLKTAYEILALPLTNYTVKIFKKNAGHEVFDNGISYDPFKITQV